MQRRRRPATPTRFFRLASGVAGSASGVSDLGGADSLVSLGLWGADGQTVPVESGTFMHELGHTLGLTHGGLFRTPVPPVAGVRLLVQF